MWMMIVGYHVAWDWIADNIKRAQDYLLQNTTLGIPTLVQAEGRRYISGSFTPDSCPH